MASLSRIRNITDKHPVLTGFCLVLVALAVLRVLLVIVAVRNAAEISLHDFPGSVWESEEPFVRLEVSETPGDGINGFLIDDGEKREICLITTAGNAAEVVDFEQLQIARQQGRGVSEEMILMEVMYRFKKDNLVVKVESDYVYDKQYRVIALLRVR